MAQKLFQYQEDGAQWLATMKRAGLHDEMGVGKTATLIRALELIGARRAIVVAPANLRENWVREFRKFSDVPWRLCKGVNVHDYVAWQRNRFQILITSYEQITKWAPYINANCEVLDAVVMDESHYLKNPNTARTKALFGVNTDGWMGVVGWAKHAWTATGTPIPNDPKDIYTFLQFTQAINMSLYGFTRQFFHQTGSGRSERTQCKPEAAPVLREMIGRLAVRRTKKMIGMQLPPVLLGTCVLDGDDAKIKELLSEHPGLEEAIVAAIETGGLSFLDAQHIATLRRLVGQAKLVPYCDMLLNEIRSGQTSKRVVFGVHREALRGLHDYLTGKGVKSVIIQGGVSEANRIEAVDSFQNDPDCKVFIGNIRAAGTGLTLTASCELDMLESDWTPAGNAQAIMRVHRIGQDRNVTARFITLANSIDEKVNSVVAEKTRAIAEIEGEKMHASPLTQDESLV